MYFTFIAVTVICIIVLLYIYIYVCCINMLPRDQIKNLTHCGIFITLSLAYIVFDLKRFLFVGCIMDDIELQHNVCFVYIHVLLSHSEFEEVIFLLESFTISKIFFYI